MGMGETLNLFTRLGRQGRLRKAIAEQHPRLYRIAWSWCHNEHQAQDLAQDTIASALESVDSLRDEARLEVWLTRILANRYRDQIRRTREDTGFEDELSCTRDTPETALDRAQIVSRTRTAVQALSEDHRQVLTLVDLAEFSYAETAGILDLPIGTVMSRLARARQRLRELLEQADSTKAKIIAIRRS